jgi:protein required for attachment to host cells
MNLNSLVIAADASRARLYRTAHPNDLESEVELIEMDTIGRFEPHEAPAEARQGCSADEARSAHGSPVKLQGDELPDFARRIAQRTAKFAQFHYCNPVVILATADMYPALLDELARELPHVYVRSVIGDTARLPAAEIMKVLLEHEVFTAVKYAYRG